MKLLSIAFHLFILIKYTYQSCGIITNLGDMVPVEQDIEVNSDIVFNCTLHPDSGYNSSSIFFAFFEHDIPQRYVKILDKYSAQLTIPNAHVNQSGRYHCKANNEKEGRKPLVCLSEARVGYKPADLPVTDFSCKYLYRQEMRCSWTKPFNRIATNINLHEVKLAMRGFESPCPFLSDENDRMTCTWSRSTSHRATYHAKYHFMLTQQNSLGKHDQYFTFNLSSIVQLDPPPNLTFHRDRNVLSWNYPNVLENDDNLFHLLQFKVIVSEICEHSDDVCEDSQPKVFALDNTKRTLTLALKPYKLYNFSIACKVDDPLNKYWSNSTSIISRTKEDAPASPPELISQAFETSSTKPRSATVYWKPLPRHLMNGPQVEYLVKVVDLLTKVQSNITTTYTKHTFDSLNPTSYEFQIYSKNSIGLSNEYSSITLPASGDILRPPGKVAVIVGTNSYDIEFEKSNLQSVQDYTIFWCVAKNDHCIEEINWKYVTRNYTLRPRSHSQMKFGISTNTQHSSSGIYWTQCVVNPKVKVDKLRTVHPFPHGSTSILLKWDFLCEAQKRLVTDLVVEYCPKEDCVPENKRSVTVDNLNTDQSLVGGLEPNTTYLFTVSSAGIAEASQVYGTTDLSVPVPPFDLAIVDATDNTSTIQWRFNAAMVDHFRVKAPFLSHDLTVVKEGCNESSSQCQSTLAYSHDLKAYFNYSIAVSACNIKGHCSNSSEVYFQTAPSRPGKMLVPTMEKLSTSKFRVHFKRPADANGPINFFYVRQQHKEEVKRYSGGEPFADLTVECEHTFQTEVFKVQVFASNLLNGEELKGEPSEWASIDLCKAGGMYFIIIVMAIILFVIIVVIVYCTVDYMNSLKMKKKTFQINIQCNQRDNDLNFEPYEKDNLVHPEENELNQATIAERRKISSSVTNASMTSDSSIAENSHSSDKNCPSSSSDNCYGSDSTANYSDINYRENHEYFLNPMDDSCRPLMSPSAETERETPPEPSTALPLDMDKASELNKSPVTYVPSCSQFDQKPVAKAVYVPLSPIQAPVSPPANLNSNSHYVSHAFAAQQNLKNSTNV